MIGLWQWQTRNANIGLEYTRSTSVRGTDGIIGDEHRFPGTFANSD